MKRKEIVSFWIGFVVTAAVVAWLYWLWQQRREVTPRPLIVSSSQPELTSPPKELAARPEKTAAEDPASNPDDLTMIKGIGPVFSSRLNKAGIYTYAQLASQTPEKLQSITDVTRWDPADWIAAARDLIE